MSHPPSRIKGTMPPPPSRRPGAFRSNSVTPFTGRSSPALSIAGTKRKERDFDPDATGTTINDGHDSVTNINVYVRCRGRNEREIKENSGVVVNTDGVKGKTVELSMGPNALSNKTYHFDRVFGRAADQIMISDEVLKPILADVLGGLNCTVFAYGQTGTGKTYTMSGDISDQLPLPENAGIIPRALHELLSKLDSFPNSPTSGNPPETQVKVSFIELYNEELRDLLSAEENSKLKILDGEGKRGHQTALVQGMEEKYITSFHQGIRHLMHGSHKRQVASTKCNDLSSRSHTVFTITVYMKKTLESGEEYMSTGKLNLVDLAGSENIGRSGAENKRAAEAGLINKSLLTLGRVINALVDKSPHIPYRESKLTRLLQDSLGGRTKTCIIATLSPSKSNLLETISTLDYAFRAKNIRNKPQINQLFSKKTLMKELTIEIERLKSELIITRQKNGVFLTQEGYDDMKNESESRRLQVKEQQERIETMECNLRNKVEELYSLTTGVKILKEDNEAMRASLDTTKAVLDRAEEVLADTRQALDEETYVRQQLERTETQLANLGQGLINTIGSTTTDIGALHSKLRRRSDLHTVNKQHWAETQAEVSQVTKLVEGRLQQFKDDQTLLVERMQYRLRDFVEKERAAGSQAKLAVLEKTEAFERSHKQLVSQTSQSKDELNTVLNEIKDLRDEVKSKVGEGLQDLGKATDRISAGIMSEIEAFGGQLLASYSGLGRDFKSLFDDLSKEIEEQRAEIDALRLQMTDANVRVAKDTVASIQTFQSLLKQDQAAREQEDQEMMDQIQALVEAKKQKQESRMQELADLPAQLQSVSATHTSAASTFSQSAIALIDRSNGFSEKIVVSRDTIKAKIQTDFASANTHTDSLRSVTSSVHDEASRITQEQIQHLDKELYALDDVVARIQEQNNVAHEARTNSLADLASGVQSSYKDVEGKISDVVSRVSQTKDDMDGCLSKLQGKWGQEDFQLPIVGELSNLREQVETISLEDYAATGQTPARNKTYSYRTTIPRTEDRATLVRRMQNGNINQSDDFLFTLTEEGTQPRSPSKGIVFADRPSALNSRPDFAGNNGTSGLTAHGLRELDLNTFSSMPPPTDMLGKSTSSLAGLHLMPPLKRINTTGNTERKAAHSAKSKRGGLRSTVAGKDSLAERENLTMPNLSASVGAGSVHPGIGRRLRSRDRNLNL